MLLNKLAGVILNFFNAAPRLAPCPRLEIFFHVLCLLV